MRLLLTFFLIIMSSLNSYADDSDGVTVKSYRKFVQDPSTRVAAQYFVMGVGLGYVFGSAWGQAQLGNQPIVCPPPKLPISGSIVLNIFDNYIKNLRPDMEDQTIIVVMPFALQNALPCN